MPAVTINNRSYTVKDGTILAALKEVATNPVENEKIRDVYTTLAAAGYAATYRLCPYIDYFRIDTFFPEDAYHLRQCSPYALILSGTSVDQQNLRHSFSPFLP